MQVSYTSNYFKIYIWQGISLILNFLSMFIVVPYLTSQPPVYGIYTVCISVSIFLAYADLGFLGAGQKYAAEYYARSDTKKEIQIIGFTSFILLIFLLLFSFVFLFLSFNPTLLIKNLGTNSETSIASSLLFILALFTPVTLLQRLLQMIYGIRLKDYIIQRSNIIGSFFKILSIFWFFRNGQYNIIGYFLFLQIVNLLVALITLFIAKRLFNYNFKALIHSMRFSQTVLSKTKNLALTSLFLTITWILYYELDPTIIGKFIGVKQVAIYAIGLTILSFFRSLFGIIFSPFNARFNHFVGINDLNGLKNFYLHVNVILAPLIIIPILVVTLLAKPLILSWVGINYYNSIEIAQFLILCNIFAFITYPTGMLLMAQERVKEMYFINSLIPIIYWSGIVFTYTFFGLKAFAIFKFFAFGISAIAYFVIMMKFISLNFRQLISKIFYPIFIPVTYLLIISFVIRGFLPCEKSKLNLFIVSSSAGVIIITSFIIQYFSSKDWRLQIFKMLKINDL